MVLERRFERLGRHRHAILCALAVPNRDLISGEVSVLNAQPQAFHEPQPAP
jgi:hypothetical protein